LAEIAVVDLVVSGKIRAWELEVYIVEEIERFGAELQTHSFRQLEVLEQRRVDIKEVWAGECVAPQIAGAT
jgi:hypothetical protein